MPFKTHICTVADICQGWMNPDTPYWLGMVGTEKLEALRSAFSCASDEDDADDLREGIREAEWAFLAEHGEDKYHVTQNEGCFRDQAAAGLFNRDQSFQPVV